MGDRYLLWSNGWNIYGDTKMYSFNAFSDSMLDFTREPSAVQKINNKGELEKFLKKIVSPNKSR